MKRTRIKSTTVFLALILIFASAAAAAPATRHSRKTARKTNLSLFATFRQIDSHLTAIDHDMQHIDSQIKQPQNETRRSRARVLAELRRSKQLRSLRRSSSSLLVLSSRAEARFRKSKQRYGALLFASLHRHALAMRKSERRLIQAKSWPTLQTANKAFSKDLLSFVLQFQAISGGYAALECGSGAWSCCQPKTMEQTGMNPLRGCTWLCVQRRAECRTGCLGPRTPQPPRAAVSAAAAPK
ncbi:MAG TPA: hypothetical protein VFQ00_03065 [Terriglobales bacterium]|nr:hypothetical protein [Terriglobales bacterium]